MARLFIPIVLIAIIAAPALGDDPERGVLLTKMTEVGANPVLEKVAETYKKTQTYQDHCEMVIEMTMQGMDNKITVPYDITIKKPDKIHIQSDNPLLGIDLVSDGKNIWIYNKRANEYTKGTAPSLLKIAKDPSIIPGKGIILLSTIVSDDPLAEIEEGVASKKLLKPERIDGRECDVIVLEQPPANVTAWIDTEKKVIVKLQMDMGNAMKRALSAKGETPPKLLLTEYHRNVILDGDIADKEFTFTPPAGAKLVDEFTTRKKAIEEREQANLTGTAAPDFTLQGLDGKDYSLKSFKGKIVLIDFWATWCPPCRKELPYIQKIHDELSSQGLVVLGITTEKDEAKIKKFLQKEKISFPILRDATRTVSKGYKVTAIPRLLIIGKDGIIKSDFTGLRTEEELKEALGEVGITAPGKKR